MEENKTTMMSARALGSGHEILWYKIKDVLGQGGFGITYRAHDQNLDRDVAIKEYLPTPFAYRYQDFSVKPLTGDHQENYAWGLGSFLKEAQTLAKFKHGNIVQVHSVFEHNNTAYMVMEYEHGQSLSAIYKTRTGADQSFYEGIFYPIFEGLVEIHNFGFIHRDIKPANIYIREDNTPVLIDFGSARQTSQQQTGEMTTLVSQGYTPLEQYSSNYGSQGPWTDVYAIAASIYEGIVGRKPDESLSRSACLLRSKPDLVRRLSASDYPGFTQEFLDAVHAGLELEPEKRPQDLAEWLEVFKSGRPASMGGSFSQFSSNADEQTRVQPHHTGRRVPATEKTDEKFPPEGSSQSDLRAQAVRAQSDGRLRPAADMVKKERSGSVALLGGAAVLAIALGAFMWYSPFGSNSLPQVIDSEMLAGMPRPSVAFATTLPKEKVEVQLADLSVAGNYYNDAMMLNADDDRIQRGVDASFEQLKVIAGAWSASNHGDITNQVETIAKLLPGRESQRNEILTLIHDTNQLSGYEEMLKLLDAQNFVSPVGNSVLDLVTQLSKADFTRVRQSAEWSEMMDKFRSAAIEKIELRDFDGAVRVVEAALAIDPSDPQMNAVRGHLSLH